YLPTPFLSLISFCTSTPTTELYTLSLHDALPIFATAPQTPRFSLRFVGSCSRNMRSCQPLTRIPRHPDISRDGGRLRCCVRLPRSEEHTSELQSRRDLVCRLLLEKKKKRGKVELG